MFEGFIVSILAGLWGVLCFYVGIWTERYFTKQEKQDRKRLKAMYEAAKGDLDDTLRSRDELTNEYLDLLKDAGYV